MYICQITVSVQQLPDLLTSMRYECWFGSYVFQATKTNEDLGCVSPPGNGIPPIQQGGKSNTQLGLFNVVVFSSLFIPCFFCLFPVSLPLHVFPLDCFCYTCVPVYVCCVVTKPSRKTLLGSKCQAINYFLAIYLFRKII